MARNIYQQKLNTVHGDNFSKKSELGKKAGQTVRHSEVNPFKIKSGSISTRGVKRGRTVETILPEIEPNRKLPESPDVKKSKTSLLLQDLKPVNRRFKNTLASESVEEESNPGSPRLNTCESQQLKKTSNRSSARRLAEDAETTKILNSLHNMALVQQSKDSAVRTSQVTV